MTIIEADNDIGQLVEEYLDWALKVKGSRPLTVRMYGSSLRRFCDWWEAPLETIRAEDIETFAARPLVKGKRRGEPPAAATVRRETATLRKFLEWCDDRKGIATRGYRTAVAPRVPAGTPKPIPDEHWIALWESDTLPPDDRLWLGLGYFLGIRRYEMVTMRPEDVDTVQRNIDFIRKTGKRHIIDYESPAFSVADQLPHVAKGVDGWLVLLEEMALKRQGEKHLSVYAHADDPFLDGNRMSKRITMLLMWAGLPHDLFTVHQLRHSCATNLFRAGWNGEEVQELLGHTSFNVTKGYMQVAGTMRSSLRKRGVIRRA